MKWFLSLTRCHFQPVIMKQISFPTLRLLKIRRPLMTQKFALIVSVFLTHFPCQPISEHHFLRLLDMTNHHICGMVGILITKGTALDRRRSTFRPRGRNRGRSGKPQNMDILFKSVKRFYRRKFHLWAAHATSAQNHNKKESMTSRLSRKSSRLERNPGAASSWCTTPKRPSTCPGKHRLINSFIGKSQAFIWARNYISAFQLVTWWKGQLLLELVDLRSTLLPKTVDKRPSSLSYLKNLNGCSTRLSSFLL